MAEEKGAPAAAAAPAPGAEAPKVDAIQDAIDAARERVEKGEPLLTEELIAKSEGREPPPSGDADPAKKDEDGGSGEAATKGDGEEKVDGEEEEEEVDPEDDPNNLTVLLPGRRDGEEDFEITVDTPEAKERLAQLRNGYLRGEQVRAREAQIDTMIAEVQDFREMVETDPVGLMHSAVPQWAKAKIAMALLTDEKVYAEVKEKLALLEDPDEFRHLKNEVEKEAAGLQTELQKSAEVRREQMKSATMVVQSIGIIAPPDLSPTDARDFSAAALEQLKRYATRTGAITIAPADVPAILAPWMRKVGIDPVAAAARLGEAMSKGRSGAGKEKGPAKRAAAKSTTPPAKTGKAFLDGSAKKRAAASAAPAGAGTPAGTGLTPPKNQTIEERVEWLRNNGGIAALSGA